MLDLDMLGRVVEKSGAETHLEVVGLQNTVVSAALATSPEFRVVCEKCERNRSEADFVVHLHNRSSGRDTEDLCFREQLT